MLPNADPSAWIYCAVMKVPSFSYSRISWFLFFSRATSTSTPASWFHACWRVAARGWSQRDPVFSMVCWDCPNFFFLNSYGVEGRDTWSSIVSHFGWFMRSMVFQWCSYDPWISSCLRGSPWWLLLGSWCWCSGFASQWYLFLLLFWGRKAPFACRGFKYYGYLPKNKESGLAFLYRRSKQRWWIIVMVKGVCIDLLVDCVDFCLYNIMNKIV